MGYSFRIAVKSIVAYAITLYTNLLLLETIVNDMAKSKKRRLFMDSRDLKFRWQRRGYNTDSD